MLTHELKDLPASQPTRLRNIVCPYCGAALDAQNTSKEHVIGRRFVPKGTLDGSWNLILNACVACNNRKSDLEDDISAITMQPDVLGRHFGPHTQLAKDGAHKARRTRSRYTGKLVGESRTASEVKFDFGGMTMTFNFVGQQQIADDRLFELALRHWQALFYFITYNEALNRGWWWTGNYAPIQAVSKNDWGNERALAFMRQTSAWDFRVLLIAADGHFKLAIRRHPSKEMWSLALEWNENYRVFAACGQEEALLPFLNGLPKPQAQTIHQAPDIVMASRIEQALKPEDDTLFEAAA